MVLIDLNFKGSWVSKIKSRFGNWIWKMKLDRKFEIKFFTDAHPSRQKMTKNFKNGKKYVYMY